MTAFTPEQTVRRLLDAWNAGDRDTLAGLLHPAIRSQLLHHYDELDGACSHLQVCIDALVAQHDHVAARLHVSGVHDKGPFAGVQPTGTALAWESFRFYRVVSGQIAQTWAMQDRLGLYQQLGVVPPLEQLVNWATPEASSPATPG